MEMPCAGMLRGDFVWIFCERLCIKISCGMFLRRSLYKDLVQRSSNMRSLTETWLHYIWAKQEVTFSICMLTEYL